MIDSDDGDVFWLWGLSNQHQCESRQCPKVTQSAKLLDGECLCVEVAR